MSGVTDIRREKSPMSLSSLSDYDGSEASHTERRFLRLYEELEAHSSGIKILIAFTNLKNRSLNLLRRGS